MEILTGLFDNMVLQRNRQNVSDATITGTAAAGTIQFRVQRNGRTLKGYSWNKLAQVAKGKFSACIKGLPVGGPYCIELRLIDKQETELAACTVENVLVGDVWICAGQSNMEGIAQLIPAIESQDMVRAFYMHDQWDVAQDPVHNREHAIDPVHPAISSYNPALKHRRRGPVLPFGLELYRKTGVPQGLIACAHGGTSMAMWDPRKKRLKGHSLYGAMLRRFVKNGSSVAGMIWYQGCSEAIYTSRAAEYAAAMKRFISAVRRDFKSPRLPIVMIQISHLNEPRYYNMLPWNQVQEQQRLLGQQIEHCVTVPTIDFTLDDSIHLDGASQIRLGARIARAMIALKRMEKGIKLPIRLKAIDINVDRKSMCANIEVSFDNVVQALTAPGTAAGFSISNGRGDVYDTIFKTELKRNKVVLKTSVVPEHISDMFLHYGAGLNPHCNITDAADQSLPVFGPLPLGEPRAVSDYVMDAMITPCLPAPEVLCEVPCPTLSDDSLSWYRCQFRRSHMSRYDEFKDHEPQDELVYYCVRMYVPELMQANLCLGYDGPVKVWLDSREVYYDALRVDALVPDKTLIPCELTPGMHEIMLAMTSKHGTASGILLRLERTDVDKKILRTSPWEIVLPEFVPVRVQCGE